MEFFKSVLISSIVSLLALLAPFFFPAPIAFAIGIFAGLFMPAILIVNGGLIDLLYFTSAQGTHVFPYFTLLGIIFAVLAGFVQQFLKTRIMS